MVKREGVGLTNATKNIDISNEPRMIQRARPVGYTVSLCTGVNFEPSSAVSFVAVAMVDSVVGSAIV